MNLITKAGGVACISMLLLTGCSATNEVRVACYEAGKVATQFSGMRVTTKGSVPGHIVYQNKEGGCFYEKKGSSPTK